MSGQLGGWLRGENDPDLESETDVEPEIDIVSGDAHTDDAESVVDDLLAQTYTVDEVSAIVYDDTSTD